jgi:hypothetical protein
MALIEHDHALSSRRTVRLDLRSEMKTILVVETDLALTPEDPGFDLQAFDSLVDAIREYLKTHDYVDSADIQHISR